MDELEMTMDISDLSAVARSNLVTMQITSHVDKRQTVPESYTVSSMEVRKLRAELIPEEAMETVKALGFKIRDDGEIVPHGEEADLQGIIDGCCDTIYVATGTLCAVGAPDVPHMDEVIRANEDKFPDGVAICGSNGKYMKPQGWTAPNHFEVIANVIQAKPTLTMRDIASRLMAGRTFRKMLERSEACAK